MRRVGKCMRSPAGTRALAWLTILGGVVSVSACARNAQEASPRKLNQTYSPRVVTEGQPERGDFTFFGYVIGFEAEWGYFTLKELDDVNIKGLVIERDESFEPQTLSSCLAELTDGQV